MRTLAGKFDKIEQLFTTTTIESQFYFNKKRLWSLKLC